MIPLIFKWRVSRGDDDDVGGALLVLPWLWPLPSWARRSWARLPRRPCCLSPVTTEASAWMTPAPDAPMSPAAPHNCTACGPPAGPPPSSLAPSPAKSRATVGPPPQVRLEGYKKNSTSATCFPLGLHCKVQGAAGQVGCHSRDSDPMSIFNIVSLGDMFSHRCVLRTWLCSNWRTFLYTSHWRELSHAETELWLTEF